MSKRIYITIFIMVMLILILIVGTISRGEDDQPSAENPTNQGMVCNKKDEFEFVLKSSILLENGVIRKIYFTPCSVDQVVRRKDFENFARQSVEHFYALQDKNRFRKIEEVEEELGVTFYRILNGHPEYAGASVLVKVTP